jgi:hypothetical protein
MATSERRSHQLQRANVIVEKFFQASFLLGTYAGVDQFAPMPVASRQHERIFFRCAAKKFTHINIISITAIIRVKKLAKLVIPSNVRIRQQEKF